jgi:hypothetical protein
MLPKVFRYVDLDTWPRSQTEMIITPPSCTEPGEDHSVWRYMDLSKLIYLIGRRKLFMPCVARLQDNFEGRYSSLHFPGESDIQSLVKYARDNLSEAGELTDTEIGAAIHASACASNMTVSTMRPHCYVSCWHQNQFESAAMWAIYATAGKGIAIRTTYSALKRSIMSCIHGGLLLSAQVSYLDYDQQKIDPTNFFLPFMSKRKSFEFEREVRLLCVDLHSILSAGGAGMRDGQEGIDLDVDVGVLIEEVFVAPTTPEWLRASIEDV